MDNNEANEIDMFEHIEDLPKDVQKVLKKHEKTWDKKDGYKACRDLVEDLEKVGYTCEYYLDAEPFNLHKINLEESEK